MRCAQAPRHGSSGGLALLSGNPIFSLQTGLSGNCLSPMTTANFHQNDCPTITPRFDDDEDDEKEEKSVGKNAGPVGAVLQRKFLDQRKIFLWGAVTDETAKDLTEK